MVVKTDSSSYEGEGGSLGAGGPLSDKALLDAKDLVKMGFTRSMAYQLLNRQDLPCLSIGGRKFMHRVKFDEWLANQARG